MRRGSGSRTGGRGRREVARAAEAVGGLDGVHYGELVGSRVQEMCGDDVAIWAGDQPVGEVKWLTGHVVKRNIGIERVEGVVFIACFAFGTLEGGRGGWSRWMRVEGFVGTAVVDLLRCPGSLGTLLGNPPALSG